MSKRRRTNSIASSKDGESLDGNGNGNGESSGQSVRKRRKKQDPMELVQQVYDSIRQQRKEDGTLLCDAFIRIPKRRQAPLYYELVRRPLDLLRVQQKLKTDEYGDIDDLQADIELIVSNAKQFHRKTSHEYRDAQDLLTLFYRNKAKIIDGVTNMRSTVATSSPHSLLVRGGSSGVAAGSQRRSLSSLLQQRSTRGFGGAAAGRARARRSLPALRNHHANHHLHHRRQVNNTRRRRQHTADNKRNESDDDVDESEPGDDDDDEDDEQVRTHATPKNRQSARRPQRRQQRQLQDDNDSGRDEEDTNTTTTTSRSSATVTGEDAHASVQTLNATNTAATTASHTNNAFEELFTAIMTATDSEGEPLHTEFQLLPSRRKYPRYYDFIDTPIDLRMIARKIQSNSYRTLADMERDVHTLTRNACVFNEPGSHIYRSAKTLRRMTQQKRLEMEQNGYWKPGGRGQRLAIESKSERIRNRRMRGNAMSLSAITAALKDDSEDEDDDNDDNDEEEDEEAEDEEEEDDENQASANDSDHSSNGSGGSSVATMDSDNPKWQLFDAVRGVRSPGGGAVLSEPFWRLPSRRFYPDYYREIKNPVSLTQIRRKLTSHLYGTVSEVAGDLTVVFENAKRYNDDNSKLYKDAVKLQKVMQLKLQELLDIDQDFDTDLEPEYKRRGPKPKQLLPNTAGGIGQQSALPRGRPPKDANRQLTDNTRLMMQHAADNNQTAATKLGDNYAVLLKKRLHTVAKFLLDYKKSDGRQPLLAFVEKPSKKLYPDYYEVIREPIDFLDIEARIKAGRYASERDMVRDFRLMFSNCRTYNETNSPLYEDACLLEKVLLERIASITSIAGGANAHLHASSLISSANSVNQQTLNVNRVGKGRRALSPNARRCKSLYDTIREYREPKASRQLSTIFLKLPSKSDYPDYYEVIPQPIDLERIGHKAKQGKYHEVDDIAADLVLMFDNACKFNEPDSQVYKDALVLHQLTLQHKRKLKQVEMDAQGGGDGVPDVQAHLQDMLLDLFTSVYNHQDEEERCYSDSLAELPEHDAPSPTNELGGGKTTRGRRGLSLDLIKRRLDGSQYQRLDTFQADVFACLERARRLSRTDSQVFEDAVELQRFFVRRRDIICRDGQVFRSPALRYTLQRLNEDLDEMIKEKRITEDAADVEEELLSVTEDAAADKSTISLTNGPTVDQQDGDGIKCDGDEKKEDQVQSTNAQRAIRVGDFVYLESGPASTATITSASSLKRHNHGLNNNHNSSSSSSGSTDNSRDKDKETEPHIVLIERIFTGSGGRQMIYGSKYLRPAETYHVSTRRFLEREVFKSDTHVTAPYREVAGRCSVLSVKVYFTQRPADFRDEDVYVLESRYSTRMRNFKKIKIFRDLNHLTNIELVARETPIEPKRVMSVFRERLEKHKDELQELQECLESEWSVPNVPLVRDEELELDSDGLSRSVRGGRPTGAGMDHDHRNTYYEQYAHQGTVLKTGDFVYVMTDGGRQMIAQISAIWTNKDGKEFFHGPWFVTPSEVPPSPTRLFYKQEVFLSTVEDTNPLLSIVGKCSVLHYNEFIASRVTEVPEADVYICTSLLDEVNRQVKRLPPGDGLRKVNHRSPLVQEDELFFFPRILNPPKKVNKTKVVTGYILYSRDVRKNVCVSNPDSNFGEISKIVGNDWRALPQGIKQSWEERAMRTNEEAKERDRQLQLEEGGGSSPAPPPPPPDQVFECLWDKCDFQFEEVSDCVEHCIRDRETGGGHVQSYYLQRGQDSDLNCMWRGCGRNNKKNVQPFPNMARLTRHVRDMHINKGNGRSVVPEARSKNFKPSSKVSSAGAVLGHLGHLQQHQSNSGGSATALSSAQQLHASTSATNPATSHLTGASGTAAAAASAAAKLLQQQQQAQYEPMFISVPPRPQRALHSEAYIKYIEGLHAENKFISPWERTLTATQQSVQQSEQQASGGVGADGATALADQNKLQHVMAWLGPQYHQQPYQQNHQEHVVNALWALRNHLLKDALGLQKTL